MDPRSEFKAVWPPSFPAGYVAYMQKRWAPIVECLRRGDTHGDTPVMIGNLAGMLVVTLADPQPLESMGGFFDNVVAALGSDVERLRAQFEEYVRGLVP